jgi:uncharacterized protein (DUF1330 family)
MPAYLLANVDVSNAEGYKEYVERNTPLVQNHGGRFVVRGGHVEVLEGEWVTHRVVLIEFPNGDAARAWYNSPEYQAIAPIRQRNTRSGLLAIIESAA